MLVDHLRVTTLFGANNSSSFLRFKEFIRRQGNDCKPRIAGVCIRCGYSVHNRARNGAKRSTGADMAESEDQNTEIGDEYSVFYCCNCREILGDSLSTVRVNKDLQSISLQIVTDAVIVTSACETSVDDPDKGRRVLLKADEQSSYNILECKSCQSSVGRYYKTTARAFDCIRDMYTLDLNQVKSYDLGSTSSTHNFHLTEDPTENLKKSILKIQSLVYALYERVEKLESYFEEVDVTEDNITVEQKNESHKKKRKIK